MAERQLAFQHSSSNIKAATYDEDTQTLRVQFFNGGTYQYDGVSGDKALAFERADSPGKFLHANLKGEHVASKIG
jgi:hypothetical protein